VRVFRRTAQRSPCDLLIIAAIVIIATLLAASCRKKNVAATSPVVSQASPHIIFPDPPSTLAPDSVLANYDKFKDQWLIASTDQALTQPEPTGPYDIRSRPMTLYVRAAIARQGQEPPPLGDTAQVILIITSYATDWQFLNDHTLRLIVDGRRFTYATDRESEVSPLIERLAAEMPITDFLDLSRASYAEGQVGNHDFRFSQEALANLRTFASVVSISPNQLSEFIARTSQASRPFVPSTSINEIAPPPVPKHAGNQQPSSPRSDRSASTEVATRRPKPAFEQVYADAKTLFYYPEECSPLPAKAFRVAKSVAIRQGYKLAPICGGQ